MRQVPAGCNLDVFAPADPTDRYCFTPGGIADQREAITKMLSPCRLKN